MNIADKLKKIRVFLTNYGFVAILEKMTAAVMTQVEDHCIACQQATHKDG
ncbi:hypothetical protein JCM15764A_08010 [Geotalea toluenoxydans]